MDLTKDVPQGSILGPQLFNIFFNDIYFFVDVADLLNYADDNTVSHTDKDLKSIYEILSQQSEVKIELFTINQMLASPDQFQAMIIERIFWNPTETNEFHIRDTGITPEPVVKRLGVLFDNKLSFNDHISQVCCKASHQLNVLRRIGFFFEEATKLLIYNCFIKSHFDYCSLVWYQCGIENSKKLERIQERALRFVYDDTSLNYEITFTKGKH